MHRPQQWERSTELPLALVALVFLVAYALPILNPDASSGTLLGCTVAQWVIWATFALDYLVRLRLSPHRREFVRTNLLDLVVIVLPLLRPLRLLRLVSLLSVLNRSAGGSLRGRVVTYVAGAAGVLVVVASLAVLDAERSAQDGNLTTFGDALWWSLVTVTTVGYGDHYPVTATGRVVAVGLMVSGIALLGVVTAAFASWLVEKVQQLEEEQQAVTRREIRDLTAEVALLRGEIAELTRPSTHETAVPRQPTHDDGQTSPPNDVRRRKCSREQ